MLAQHQTSIGSTNNVTGSPHDVEPNQTLSPISYHTGYWSEAKIELRGTK